MQILKSSEKCWLTCGTNSNLHLWDCRLAGHSSFVCTCNIWQQSWLHFNFWKFYYCKSLLLGAGVQEPFICIIMCMSPLICSVSVINVLLDYVYLGRNLWSGNWCCSTNSCQGSRQIVAWPRRQWVTPGKVLEYYWNVGFMEFDGHCGCLYLNRLKTITVSNKFSTKSNQDKVGLCSIRQNKRAQCTANTSR